MSDDASRSPRKRSPIALTRADAAHPRALRPVSGADTWGAAPMPPADAPKRKLVAIAAVCGATLASAAMMALHVTRPAEEPSHLSHGDTADWASRMKRMLAPKVERDDDDRHFRTAGIAPRPRLTPPAPPNTPPPSKIPDSTPL